MLTNWRGRIHKACSLVKWAAHDRISLLPKLAIHCFLPSAAYMRDAQKASLLCTSLYSVHPEAGVAPDMTLRFTTQKQVIV